MKMMKTFDDEKEGGGDCRAETTSRDMHVFVLCGSNLDLQAKTYRPSCIGYSSTDTACTRTGSLIETSVSRLKSSHEASSGSEKSAFSTCDEC